MTVDRDGQTSGFVNEIKKQASPIGADRDPDIDREERTRVVVDLSMVSCVVSE